MTPTLLQWEKTHTMKAQDVAENELVVPVNIVKIILAEQRQMIANEIEKVLNEEIKSSQQWGHQGLLPIETLKKIVLSNVSVIKKRYETRNKTFRI